MYSSVYGRGNALRTITESETYKSKEGWDIPYLCTSVIDNKGTGELIVFAANRSLDEEMELALCFENFGDCKLIEHIELYSDDIKATNDKDNERIVPVSRPIDTKLTLRKHSWNMLRFIY